MSMLRSLRGRRGWLFRVIEVLASVATVLGLYFGVYTILLAPYELRLNRASYERSAFIDLVTSNNRAAFVAAMQRFGPVQTMEVPPEPALFPPFLNWWDEPNRPNMEPLYTWAKKFFPLCTPQLCGVPDRYEPNNAAKGIRINLIGANLSGAHLEGANLIRADLSWADLKGAHLSWADLKGAHLRKADLEGADLRGADLDEAHLYDVHLEGADLRGADLNGEDLAGQQRKGKDRYVAFWNHRTIWPEGITPPCPYSTPSNRCLPKK
jgi:hypothetical protein